MPWYVIHTKPSQEFRAQEHLSNQGYPTYLPICQVEKVKQGKLVLEKQALFKRYLFIELDEVDTNWMPIRSTRGVHQLLVWPMSKKPILVKEELIEALKNQDMQTQHQELFKPGQSLNIVEGAFKGIQGLFQKLHALPDGELRAHLLIDFLGKQKNYPSPSHNSSQPETYFNFE